MKAKERNNEVCILGRVVSKELQFSHKIYGEKFYIFHVEVKRLNETKDIVPVLISERERYFDQIKEGEYVYIEGQFRSYNEHKNEKNILRLNVFVESLYLVDENEENINKITLRGFICKDVVYRKTPLGREITDLLLAVNRPYEKSDYIPCITWENCARFASVLEVGDEIKIFGRIQSREYMKKLEEGVTEKRIAYEVSIYKIEAVV